MLANRLWYSRRRRSSAIGSCAGGGASSRYSAGSAGAAGWWLESRRDQLGVSAGALDRLQALAPKQNRYALGAVSGAGRLAPRWRVILPEAVLNPAFEGLA